MNATMGAHRADRATQVAGSMSLAAEVRAKCFALVGDAVDVLVSCYAAHKGYLSGYFSIVHDLNPRYLSAVVATRDRVALVVSASDAGPALEETGDPAALFRYGFFCFEQVDGTGADGYDAAGFASFDEALLAALREVAGDARTIGIDRSGDDRAWTVIAQGMKTRFLTDITDAITRARRHKLPGEVARVRQATRLVETGLLDVARQFAPGMTEQDMAAIIAAGMVAGGAIPRFVSVTSGPRSALADAYATARRVAPGDLIRIDAGCIYQGYASDMARTFVFGEPDAEQARCYAAIRAGIDYELEVIREGVDVAGLFDETVRVVRENGIPSYRRQHVGHGIGLGGGYDMPVLTPQTKDRLEAGMCLCVETPYYRIGWGGMMIEDTILVTREGHEPITTIPRDLIRLG
ncbi:Xaa-Pro peptidase family protein [Tistrella mobilis]|uniref:M24 family metallopeptidase n=1 Tax=Tistrella mobilis TaxID=171437 RepID=UPI0035580C62